MHGTIKCMLEEGLLDTTFEFSVWSTCMSIIIITVLYFLLSCKNIWSKHCKSIHQYTVWEWGYIYWNCGLACSIPLTACGVTQAWARLLKPDFTIQAAAYVHLNIFNTKCSSFISWACLFSVFPSLRDTATTSMQPYLAMTIKEKSLFACFRI